MTVIIDQVWCVGAAQCVLSAPEVFDQPDQERTGLLHERPSASPHRDDRTRLATRPCPDLALQRDEP